MIKVLAACGAGIGSSQIIKMKIAKIMLKYGIQYEIDHMSVGMAKSVVNNYNLVITMAGLTNMFTNVKPETHIIGMVNLMSENEMETKIKSALGIE